MIFAGSSSDECCVAYLPAFGADSYQFTILWQRKMKCSSVVLAQLDVLSLLCQLTSR